MTSTDVCKYTSPTSMLVVPLSWSTDCGITPANTVGFLIAGRRAMRLMERLRDMLAAVSTSTLKKREQRRFGLLTKRAPDEMKNDAVSLANRMTVLARR
jgi:hypothetical protein